MSEILINALQDRSLYAHPVTQFKVIQTHLSWIILTGTYAYKIKKPLNFGFQDYTTLEKRKYYCELEFMLNQRLAPHLYLGVIAIGGDPSHPLLLSSENSTHKPIEYAIKMHEFCQQNLLTSFAKQQKLTPIIIKDLADQIASFHQNAARCEPNLGYGIPTEVYQPIQDNFAALDALSASKHFKTQFNQIAKWSTQQFEKLKPLLQSRKEQGFIRACHGDLHLGNIVMMGKHPLVFDCIEFNESFRWTDVMSDVGFLAMDLEHKQQQPLCHLWVNQYLEQTNDYEGVLLLPFYQCYRAMVRAKILSIQLSQISNDDENRPVLIQALEKLVVLGQSYTHHRAVSLTVTMGASGSGKTLYTTDALMKNGSIRLRSDVIRKHLCGLSPLHTSTKEQKQIFYSNETTQKVYFLLQSLAKRLLEAGFSVIIDATCLKNWQRELFYSLQTALNIPLTLLYFDAPYSILLTRIKARVSLNNDASEADNNVLTAQLKNIEALTEQEKKWVKTITPEFIDALIEKYHKE